MQMTRQKIENEVFSLLKQFTGARLNPSPLQLIGQDLGVTGGDSVEFQNEIEAAFSIDLQPLVDKNTVYRERNWRDRLLRRRIGRATADVRVGELIDFIMANRPK